MRSTATLKGNEQAPWGDKQAITTMTQLFSKASQKNMVYMIKYLVSCNR